MDNDLVYMQRQAARRVEQSRAYARHFLEQQERRDTRRPVTPPAHPPRLYNRPPPSESLQVPPPERGSEPLQTPRSTEKPLNQLLHLAENLDTDQWMLLGLSLLLFRGGGHAELILALLYLAL